MRTLRGTCVTLICFCLAATLGSAAAVKGSGPGAPSLSGVGDPGDWAKARQFWSFQPLHRPTVPEVRDEQWVRTPVDLFILARLEHEGLSPAPEADKLTLLRRATFDLTGLPPTPQEIRAFLADHSTDAYEKLIDRLLASPHYGERWGRHWLDVARYVQGRITFPGVKHTLGDQAYRDYVMRSFNQDKPYDRFVTEQLAGDLLPPSQDRQQEFDQITAPAFLSIGNWFDQCTDPNRLKLEMVDDMIGTTSQAFLGLTAQCARCHDHKFDPIPTSDYYALAGIFASTRIVGQFSEYWRDGRQRLLRPLAMPDDVATNNALLDQVAQKKAERWKLLSDEHARLLAQWQGEEQKYRAAAERLGHPFIHRWAAESFDGEHNLRIAQLSLNGHSLDVIETLLPTEQWVKYKVQVPHDGKYRLEALYNTDDATPISVTVNGTLVTRDALSKPTGGWELIYQRWASLCKCDLREGINFMRLDAKSGSFPRLDRFRLIETAEGQEERIGAVAAAKELHPLLLADFVNDPQQPWPTIAGIVPYLGPAQQSRLRVMDEQIHHLESTLKPCQTVVSVSEQDKPLDLPVHIRGDVYDVSRQAVPRGVPTLLNPLLPRPEIPPNASGRLQLAQWITDPRNPLTARVMANRIWQWHLGRGIVTTSSDFGARGSPPTHPELLDWLAAEFQSSGWSVKHMHRLIMLSGTYRMSSQPAADAALKDPDNKLLSHFSRRRMDAEELYDSMASTTNIIVRQQPGAPFDVEKDKNRAMYVLACNRSPKGLGGEVRKMFELFDYNDSGVPIPVRPQSTTAAQSLFWLNSPLVKHFAEKFAERLLKMDRLNDTKRVEMAYLLALGRSPSRDESAESLAYISDCTGRQQMDRQQAWASFSQALYGTVEFRYVD